ncbi:15985_t:CDS:2 [Funneliformis geosporum]|uniref:12850_t:CDS:1 n=1 Tax=Funneliformis geosporum TaxID=1117311 RepID=A0A9W4SM30_9GLOM|nr:15985_t:CDS:2 [Funneliformis geosporum]CAI2174407.1 12850_t:CDS:2 [Funneliformis geosporum]
MEKSVEDDEVGSNEMGRSSADEMDRTLWKFIDKMDRQEEESDNEIKCEAQFK